jgi:hypothetical protein
MKLTDFGLWFSLWTITADNTWNWSWSTTIPRGRDYRIYYDGEILGCQDLLLDLTIYHHLHYTIQLKNYVYKTRHGLLSTTYSIGFLLTLDDFEIIPNPNYVGGL